MAKVCETKSCTNEIPIQQGRQRPRKFCEECRPPRNRPNPRVVVLPERTEQAAPPSLVTACRTRLEAAKRHEDPRGVQALFLAELLAAGGHTAAGAAALSKELRAAMDAALAGAATERDALDELRARRERKVSSA